MAVMRDQRDDHQRAQQVPPGRRDVESQLQRVSHDGRFQREEDEGEAGVDEAGDRAADVAEAGAAGQQVHVHTVARGVQADGPTGCKDDDAGGDDGQRRVQKTVLHQQRGAHRFQDQKAGRAESRVGHPRRAPAAERPRREAQRVVFHRLMRHPAVVVAPRLHHGLRGAGDHIDRGVGVGFLQGAHPRSLSRSAPRQRPTTPARG